MRQLLTHTSGMRPELPLYDCADDAERLERLRAEPPVGVPGTYCYSDLNLLLLQHVLERISGRTLDVLIHDGITRPLGMTATHFGPCPAAAATEDQRRPWAKADRGMLRVSSTTRTPGHWAGWRATPASSPRGVTSRSSAGPCSPAARTVRRGSSARTSWSCCWTRPGWGSQWISPGSWGSWRGGGGGHTGFTGTSLVVDPVTDTFVVLLANTVHPRRRAADSGPRARAGTRVARAVRAL
ncbi:serine hydrolase domain-containing protein [Streptomyces sp. MS1.AVA.1]|uniref:Serine hydrolase domain-containing protein n=1 Tax=Streptomyces machairae TaxID=3134109 RepID=A0ABU8UJJ0_9ACTN